MPAVSIFSCATSGAEMMASSGIRRRLRDMRRGARETVDCHSERSEE
jgi:hypothetical protein